MSNKPDRYFVVMFSGISEDNIFRNGKIEYRTKNGAYPRETDLIKLIEKGFGLRQVFVKPPHEFTIDDWNDWTHGREEPPAIGDGEVEESFL